MVGHFVDDKSRIVCELNFADALYHQYPRHLKHVNSNLILKHNYIQELRYLTAMSRQHVSVERHPPTSRAICFHSILLLLIIIIFRAIQWSEGRVSAPIADKYP